MQAPVVLTEAARALYRTDERHRRRVPLLTMALRLVSLMIGWVGAMTRWRRRWGSAPAYTRGAHEARSRSAFELRSWWLSMVPSAFL